ncbi:MAG: phosphoglycerate kinase [Nanoarchaeota archaeon]|nr:phosphoglycerate kinase [Nanoarchaeota archaeon]
MKKFLTLDDMTVAGKTVLVRVDINCPIDRDSRKIMDDTRIRRHAATTLKELAEAGAKTVVLSHQGRVGDTDFVPLDQHASVLEHHLGSPVTYIDDIFGTHARESITKMKNGETLLLENVRFNSEELKEQPADALAKTMMVQKLSPLADYFVNDAFGAIHRSQASLVGFGETLPTAAGRLIEAELTALERVFDQQEKPVAFVLGGVKVPESLKVVRCALANGTADMILTGGLLGTLFLAARGYNLGNATMEVLKGKGIDTLIPDAQAILRRYEDNIMTPVDIAIDHERRIDIAVSALPSSFPIADIGKETVDHYCKILDDAKVVVMNSPMGRFEDKDFDYGTHKLITHVANQKGYRMIGGGHSAEVVRQLGIADRFDHISTGGRAALYYLAGEKTPVVTMLQKAKQTWGQAAR